MSHQPIIDRIATSPAANVVVRTSLEQINALLAEARDAQMLAGTISSASGWEAGESGRLLIDARGSVTETLVRCSGSLRAWSKQYEQEHEIALCHFREQTSARNALEWFQEIRSALPVAAREALEGIQSDTGDRDAATSLRFVREYLWKPLIQTNGTPLPIRRLERVLLKAGTGFSDGESFALDVSQQFAMFEESVVRKDTLVRSKSFVGSEDFASMVTDAESVRSPEATAKRILGSGGPAGNRLPEADQTQITDVLKHMAADNGYLVGVQDLIGQLEPWSRLVKEASAAEKVANRIKLYRAGRRHPDANFLTSRAKYGWIGGLSATSVSRLIEKDPKAKELVRSLQDFAKALDGWENADLRATLIILGATTCVGLFGLGGYHLARYINKSNNDLIWIGSIGGVIVGALIARKLAHDYHDKIRRRLYECFGEEGARLERALSHADQQCKNLQKQRDDLINSARQELQCILGELIDKARIEWETEAWKEFEGLARKHTELLDAYNGWSNSFLSASTKLVDYVRDVADRLDECRHQMVETTAQPSPILPQHRLELGTFLEADQTAVLYLNRSAPILITSEPQGARAHVALINALEPVIHRWITESPPGSTELILVDPVGMGLAFRDLIPLISRLGNHMPATVQYDQSMLKALWERLQQTISNRTHKFLSGDSITINDHNRSCLEENLTLERQIIVLVNDFSLALPASGIELQRILTNGPLCGVYLILLSRCEPMISENPILQSVIDLTVPIRFIADETGRFRFGSETRSHGAMGFDIQSLPHVSHREFNQAGEQIAGALKTKELTMDVLWDRWKKINPVHSTRGIQIPFGIAGNHVLTFDFGASRSESVHHIVVGGTGSGKSVLLHALIMSAIELYDPKDVELFLFDFKPMGTEFSIYGDLRPEHIRYVVAGAPAAVAVQVMSNIVADVKHRARLFDEANVQNLDQYNAANPESRLPRRILVMDEFQSMMSHPDANHLIAELARKGRSYGVHMVMASQTLADVNLDRQILDQILTRIVLRCPPSALSRVVQADGFLPALAPGNGAVAVTTDFGVGSEVEIGKVAFAHPHDPSLISRWKTGDCRVVDSKSTAVSVDPACLGGDIIPWGLPVLKGLSPYTIRHRKDQSHAAFCSTDFDQRVRFIRSILRHRLLAGEGDNILLLFSNAQFTQYKTDSDILSDIGEQPWLFMETWPDDTSTDNLLQYFQHDVGENHLVIILDAESGGFRHWFDNAMRLERSELFSKIAQSGSTLLIMANEPTMHRNLLGHCNVMGYGIGAFHSAYSSVDSRWAIDEDNLFVRYDVANQKHEIIQFARWQR